MVRISVLLLTLFITLHLYSIPNSFKYLTSESGLTESNIDCIFQDSRGFLWFGTLSGLNRYDGYTIKTFRENIKDSLALSNGHITSMAEDKQGRLWIGTIGGGLCVYYPDLDQFKRINSVSYDNSAITLKTIASITESPDKNTIYVGESNTGLLIFDLNYEVKEIFSTTGAFTKSLPAGSIQAVLFDKNGNLWVAARRGLISKLSPGSHEFQDFVFDPEPANSNIDSRTLFQDTQGCIWIGTNGAGAYYFYPDKLVFTHLEAGSGPDQISHQYAITFCEDWEGNILIGMDGGGIDIFNKNKVKIDHLGYDPTNLHTLNTNAVYKLFKDNCETIWIGTYAGGLNYQNRYSTKFAVYTPNPLNLNSLSYKNVKCVLEDLDGEIWIGTDGGGLNHFDPDTKVFTHFKADPSNPKWLHTNVIIHMAVDDEGDIYLGSYTQGLTLFNKKTNIFKQYLPEPDKPNSISGQHVWYIFQDSYKNIWIGLLSAGLNLFDKKAGTFKQYIADPNNPDALQSPNMKVIYEDKNRTLWIGTSGGGLHKYNRETDNFRKYLNDPKDPTSLSNMDVRSIIEDSRGYFWIATADGLNRMNRETGKFEIFKSEQGLPNNVVNGILEDNKGYLWLSTNGGLVKFDPDHMTFRKYDATDGLQGNEFNYTAQMYTSTGFMYFGGKNGLNVFNPEKITDNPHIPNIVLVDFKIFNESQNRIPLKEKGKKIYLTPLYIDNIILSHKQNVITFEFAALDFANPSKNLYKYKLEGFDETWINTTADKRYTTYMNLKGGNYTFRIIAANGDGIWNEKGLSVNLHISPPIWKRGWFIASLVIFIIWLVINYIRKREEKLRHDKEILQEKIQAGLNEVEIRKQEVQLKNKALEDKIEAEKEQNWSNIGMVRISDILSDNMADLHILSHKILTELVKYIGAEQGAFYLVDDDNESDVYLKLIAAYAPDEYRILGKRIELGEGQIGTVYSEQKNVVVNDLPSNYARLRSGLGNVSLKSMVAVPLKMNVTVIGIIELLSLDVIDEYRIRFIEKACETITFIFSSIRTSEKTARLLEQQRIQSEELIAQEEELRQNLEEMQATQEEISRKSEELTKVTIAAEQKEIEYINEITSLKRKLETLKMHK